MVDVTFPPHGHFSYANGKGEEDQDKKSSFKQMTAHFYSYLIGKNLCTWLYMAISVKKRKAVHSCAAVGPEEEGNVF